MTKNIEHYIFIATNVFLTILQVSAGTYFAETEAKSSNSETANLLDCFLSWHCIHKDWIPDLIGTAPNALIQFSQFIFGRYDLT